MNAQVNDLQRPAVLVISGADPSGGAGMQADIQALSACGVHPLPVISVLTVQDNDRVFAVHPVAPELLLQQARAVIDKIDIAALKIGIIGSRANGAAIAALIGQLRRKNPAMPVVLDPVLASGHGDALAQEDPRRTIEALLPLATLVTPNLPEAERLCGAGLTPEAQAAILLGKGCANVLIKGGHGSELATVNNRWFAEGASRTWQWSRLAGAFHGSGCTLASAIAAWLARGKSMEQAIDLAQNYCQHALASAFSIAAGQRIPNRWIDIQKEQA